MRKNLLFVAVFIFSFSLSAQHNLTSKTSQRDSYCLYKNKDQTVNHSNFFAHQATDMGLTSDDDMVLIKTQEGKNNYKHYSYEQYHKGLKVYGQKYILHQKNNALSSANGSFLPQIEVNTLPTVDETAAIRHAMYLMKAQSYAEVETELLIMDVDMPNYSGEYALVYKVDLESADHRHSHSFFIDAHSGELHKRITRHQHDAVPGRGQTRYYGEQDITVDSIAPNEFHLHDPTRGNDGIIIQGENGEGFTSTSSYFDLTNETQDEVAADALYLTAEYYDLLRDEYDWLGLDNENGSFIITYMNGGDDFLNAFWNGVNATFGSGDCNYGPLITADVVAHEFMHGIIDHTSQLIYADESGAINESMADVVGKAFEYFIDEQNFNWELGRKFALSDEIRPFRVMNDPEQVENPAYYGGPFWMEGGGVHTNSAIGNLFFVRLSDGATGTDFSGYEFDVQGIGVPEASKFIFHVNRNYLFPSSTYEEYYEASLVAAEEYFNGDQSMIDNIVEAWKSVGIPREDTGAEVDYDLSVALNAFNLQVCGFETPFDVKFTVSNKGKLGYDAITEPAQVAITINGNTVSLVDIDTPILEGESVTIVSEDIAMTTLGFSAYGAEIIYPLDQNADNDEDSGFISATEFETDDLSITGIRADIECFSTRSDIVFDLTNLSCQPFVDKSVKLVLIESFSGDTIYQEDILIDTPMFPNTRRRLKRTIDHGFTETKPVNAIIIVEDDPDEFNNTNGFEIAILDAAPVDYVNELDSRADLDDGILYISRQGFFNPFGITNHEGKDHFYATGSGPDAFGQLCINPDENFDGEVGGFFSNLVTEMVACVDYTGVDDPQLEFDLIQFRNDSLNPLSDYSSSIQVRWTGTQEGIMTIGGQEEGETVNHVIDFDPDFKGTVNIKFLNMTGSDPFFPDFLELDVNMIDYLNFGPSTSTEYLSRITDKVLLYPDPASDILNIKSETEVEQIYIYDLTGRQVMSQSINNKTVDISNLIPGYYSVLCTMKNGDVEVNRFTKISK